MADANQLEPLYGGFAHNYNTGTFTTDITTLAAPADANINRYGGDGYIPRGQDYKLA